MHMALAPQPDLVSSLHSYVKRNLTARKCSAMQDTACMCVQCVTAEVDEPHQADADRQGMNSGGSHIMYLL